MCVLGRERERACFKEQPRESECIDIHNEFAYVVGEIINMDVWACVYLCSVAILP